MLGILFAQGSAIFQAVQNIINKKIVKDEKPFVVIWYTIFMSMFFLIPTVIISGIPEIQSGFYLFLGIRLVLDVFALSLYFYALRDGDVSHVIPLSTFSVVFSLISSSIINRELPNAMGIAGILVILFGTYLLNLPEKDRRKDLLMPFKLIAKNNASRLILTSAFLYGIIYAVNKEGIQASSTSFFTLSAAIGLWIFFTIAIIYQNKGKFFNDIKLSKFPRFIPLGIIDGIKIFLFMMAVTNTYVAFADASDNTTAVYSTIFAGVIFKEKIKGRMAPILIMILGVILITLSTYFKV